jgi:hypothetical protein
MTMLRYMERLNEIRRIKNDDPGASPAIVNLSHLWENRQPAVQGIFEHKLNAWFPKQGVQAFKIHLDAVNGNVEAPAGLDMSKFCCAFAEPGSLALNVFDWPGFEGCTIPEVFAEFGLVCKEGSAKLPKRLKRGLLVGTLASTRSFSISFVNEADAPKALVDGMAFIRLSCAHRMCPDLHLQDGDTVQYSYAGPEGLAKGTAVLRKKQVSDLIVHECNLKTELRFEGSETYGTKGQRVLCIEQIHHASIPTTDLQTIVNLNAVDAMQEVLDKAFTDLERIAGDPQAANAWLQDVFPRNDWWKMAMRANKVKGTPAPLIKPILSMADEAELDAMITPVVHELVFVNACKALDVRALRARYRKGEACRGYLLPDLSCFDEFGKFAEHKEMLKAEEVQSPSGSKGFPEGTPLLITRNPNAWGEAQVKVNTDYKNFRSRTAFQISAENAVETLQLWGGADMDDQVVAFNNNNMVKAFFTSERERLDNNIPLVNLEKYIDEQVQDATGYPLTTDGQMELAAKRLDLKLGQVVNFFMNLRGAKQYDWYRLAAKAEHVGELAGIYEDYYNQGEGTVIMDLFAPTNMNEYDPMARCPVANWDPYEYIQHTIQDTEIGALVSSTATRIEEILSEERETHILAENTLICTPQAMDFLQGIMNEGDENVSEVCCNRATALAWAWVWLTAKSEVAFPEGLKDYCEKLGGQAGFDDAIDDTIAGKTAAWGRFAKLVLTGNKARDEKIIAGLAWVQLSPQRRWNKETAKYEQDRWGRDRLLWNEPVAEVWLEILKKYQATLVRTQPE